MLRNATGILARIDEGIINGLRMSLNVVARPFTRRIARSIETNAFHFS
jgi:hypothetical protein